MGSRGSPWYRHVDAALIRATAHAGDLIPQSWPAQDDDTEAEQWCAWLAQVWAQTPVAEAVAAASPVLAARVQAVCEGRRPGVGQVRRMAKSLARYLVRMRGRATPFGMFAGVAPLRFGPEASACWTDSQHVRARADTVWLAGVVARLESSAELRRRLPVMVNDLALVRAQRLVVPWQPHASAPGRSASAEVSVRHSRAVQRITHAARSPISGGDLANKLAAEIPSAPVARVEEILTELMACGVLISSLRPPATSSDGLGHVLDRLQDVNAEAVEEVAPLVRELRAIHAQLQTTDHSTGGGDGQTRRATGRRMRALSDGVEQPLMVDLRLGCTAVVPPQVAAEAESAAGALSRLTPNPAGHPGWRDYHTRFLNRYGVSAVVPVDQLIDPTAGLGFPSHYGENAQSALSPEMMSQRNERLLALAQQAALDGVREVVLDEKSLDELAADGLEGMRPAAHAELCAEVRAPTVAALAEGEFTLAVTGISPTAAALNGRFLDLLSDDDRQRMSAVYGGLPVGVEGALPAQLSFPPRGQRLENVARGPRLLPEVIPLAEHRDDTQNRVPVQDLAVTADTDRLYVVSLSRRRVVEPTVTNATARHAWPPLARLLFEIPRALSAAVSPFDWGAASCLPFLPRVRYGRSVLAPARWCIPSGELPGSDAPWPAWTAAMNVIRERLCLPANISVGTADRCLRLNLDRPMDLALLRAHLDKAVQTGDAATVSEAPTARDRGWFAGRAHEIVIPLATTTPPAPAPAMVNRSGPLPLIGREDGVLPGSQVLFAKVYGHPDGFDRVLTGHLPALLAAWEDPPQWCFVRYRDPSPHLRLRLHLSGGDYGQAAVRVGEWAADLRRRGLIGDLVLDTYHPETARYGSGAVLESAEAVFAADSAAVLTQLRGRAAAREVHPHALTAASLVDLASAMTGSLPAGMLWLLDHAQIAHDPVRDRDMIRQAVHLADPGGEQAALQAIAGGPQITAAWQARRLAAATYANRFADEGEHVKQNSVIASLLHMHHARAHGIDPDSERACHRAARAVALAWVSRQDKTEGGHG